MVHCVLTNVHPHFLYNISQMFTLQLFSYKAQCARNKYNKTAFPNK